MNPDRLIQFTFAVSIIAHGVFFLQNPAMNPFAPAPKEQLIKVRYLDKRQLQKEVLRREKPLPRREALVKLEAEASAKNSGSRGVPQYYEPEKLLDNAGGQMKSMPVDFARPNFSRPDIIAIKKKITLPEIDAAKIDNPSYISYYQIVREKIRRSAYRNYTRNEMGEVYLSFVISRDGYIRGINLIESKTTASNFLKGIASRSVKEASPFPSFPKELDYPQLSFNIVISFELE
jgi:outer membrane biosynthesis protein TonB